MRILNLKAQNIKKIVAIDITPDAHVVKISGKNGAGKTSVLDTIWWAFGGTSNVQERPIRDGEHSANITIDLGDILVERRFTPKGSTLFVYDKVGTKMSSPQKILDKLLGKLSFDPLAFRSMDSKKQLVYLKEMVNLDFTNLDEKREVVYKDRTHAKKTLADIELEHSNIKIHDDTPDEPVDVDALMQELRQSNAIIKAIDEMKSNRELLNLGITEAKEQIIKLENFIFEKKAGIDKATNFINETNIPNATEIENKISNAETLNGYLTSQQTKEALRLRIIKGNEFVQKATDKIKAIDDDKKQQLENATFPINGLGFDDSCVTFKEMPFSQCSYAEQLKISVCMAMAMNPELKVIRIAEGSTLDKDSMAQLEGIAKKHDFQIWIELVDDTGKVGLYIEDGQIK